MRRPHLSSKCRIATGAFIVLGAVLLASAAEARRRRRKRPWRPPLPAKAHTTDRLFRMLAARHGQAGNASQVGGSLGLSYHTVNSYLDYLEGAFLIRRLPAYQANLRKRLVKRPKFSWRDSGLLQALLNMADVMLAHRQC